MSSKFQFDDTREAIGADKLNDNERKEMLEKFKSAGGKITQEKEIKDRQAGTGGQKSGQRMPGQSAALAKLEAEQKAKADALTASQKASEKLQKQLSGPTARFMLRLKTFFAGLTPFGGLFAKPSFFQFLNLEVKQALVEFNLLGNDLFILKRETGKTISNHLDQKNPLYMECLERLHKIYDAAEFAKLTEYHNANPGSNIPFNTIDSGVKQLYLNLYYLYPFMDIAQKAMFMAMDIYKEDDSIEHSEKNIMDQKRKKFIKDMKIVFEVAFPKLFLLICAIDQKSYPSYSALLEKAISLDPEMKLGKRVKGESGVIASALTEEELSGEEGEEDGEYEEDAEESTEQKENPIVQSKEYKYGISLQNSSPLPELRKKHDPNSRYNLLDFNDRALLAFLYFMEFDRELSFVLTTNKIRLNVDYSQGIKIDYKQKLADIFNDSRGIMQAFDKYVDARQEFITLEQNKSPGGNYVEQSKRRENLKSKVDMEGRNIRGYIRGYCEKVTENLAHLISDMKGEKKIVENMDEAVEFESDLEGARRLNKQPVHQCILEAYCYSLALSERLATGDLFGGILEMSDEEMISSFGSTFKSAT